MIKIKVKPDCSYDPVTVKLQPGTTLKMPLGTDGRLTISTYVRKESIPSAYSAASTLHGCITSTFDYKEVVDVDVSLKYAGNIHVALPCETFELPMCDTIVIKDKSKIL